MSEMKREMNCERETWSVEVMQRRRRVVSGEWKLSEGSVEVEWEEGEEGEV